MRKVTVILPALIVLVPSAAQSPVPPASAQLPASAQKQAMVSASLDLLAEYPKCEPGIAVVKPIVPYLDREVDAVSSDTKFWEQINKIYPVIWTVLTPCAGAVTASGNAKAEAGILSLSFLLANLRGDVLAWLVQAVSNQHKKLGKAVDDYVAQNQRYLEAQQKYIHDLEQYARQAEQRRAFADTLALLMALTPPASPKVYVQQAASAPRVNLGVHCTVQPVISGQTFVNCY